MVLVSGKNVVAKRDNFIYGPTLTCFCCYFFVATVNYSKKTGLFKEQNAGFSAQIHSVTLTNT